MTHHPLLLACLRPPNPALVADLATRVTDWSALLHSAEWHGLTPLLAERLASAAVPLPTPARDLLNGLQIRQRALAQAQQAALSAVLTTFAAQNLTPLLLKGAALCHLAYSKPNLRPMRDIDLLLPTEQVIVGQQLLAKLGFDAPVPPGPLPAKHLPTAYRTQHGLPLQIELHHSLFESAWQPRPLTYTDLPRPFIPLTLGDQPAQAPHLTTILHHQWQHATTEPLRWIWVADLLGLAENYPAEIAALQTEQPRLWWALLAFARLAQWQPSPLSVAKNDPYPPFSQPIPPYVGWPHHPLAFKRLPATLTPPEWWLHTHYGLTPTTPYWQACLRHWAQLPRWAFWRWQQTSRQ